MVVKDRLPVGFAVSGEQWYLLPAVRNGLTNLQGAKNIVFDLGAGKCTQEGGGAEAVTVTCTFEQPLAPDAAVELNLSVTAEAGAHTGTNTATATAVGAATVTGANRWWWALGRCRSARVVWCPTSRERMANRIIRRAIIPMR